MKKSKHESLKVAQSLGHHLTSFAPYGDKNYADCENPSSKAKLIRQGDKAAGHALSHVCPVMEGEGRK